MITSIRLQNIRPISFTPHDESGVWGADVCLERGGSYLVDAASGKGKTSLLGFIYGERTDYEGCLVYDCQDGVLTARGSSPLPPDRLALLRRTDLSMMFQDLRLFPSLTAMENILLKNRLTGFRSESSIFQMLDRLGMADKADVPVCKLSWGQKQRVAFIRSLCQPCSFLLPDEPVSHLDARNAQTMADIIREEQAEQGFGLVVTSVGNTLPYGYTQVLKL